MSIPRAVKSLLAKLPRERGRITRPGAGAGPRSLPRTVHRGRVYDRGRIRPHARSHDAAPPQFAPRRRAEGALIAAIINGQVPKGCRSGAALKRRPADHSLARPIHDAGGGGGPISL